MSNPKIWYVSCETYVGRRRVRHSCGFETETEARQFARAAVAAGKAVYAGTIGPSRPKRFIAPDDIDHWLNLAEPPSVRGGGAATACTA
jgi:hypothetical protein